MRLALIIGLIVAMPTLATGEDSEENEKSFQWKTRDKALFISYSILNVADILQTRYAFESDDYTEANPILSPLGKNGATAFMVGSNVALYFLLDRAPKHRTTILSILNLMKIGVVGHNASIGVGFKF